MGADPPARLSVDTLRRLREAGLSVRDEPLFPPDHVCWPSGYAVFQPGDALGAQLVVWPADDGWGLEVADFAPGPGPGDFVRRVPDEDAVARDVSRFFFGDDPNAAARRAYIANRAVYQASKDAPG